jgi:hypothetical protein
MQAHALGRDLNPTRGRKRSRAVACSRVIALKHYTSPACPQGWGALGLGDSLLQSMSTVVRTGQCRVLEGGHSSASTFQRYPQRWQLRDGNVQGAWRKPMYTSTTSLPSAALNTVNTFHHQKRYITNSSPLLDVWQSYLVVSSCAFVLALLCTGTQLPHILLISPHLTSVAANNIDCRTMKTRTDEQYAALITTSGQTLSSRNNKTSHHPG